MTSDAAWPHANVPSAARSMLCPPTPARSPESEDPVVVDSVEFACCHLMARDEHGVGALQCNVQTMSRSGNHCLVHFFVPLPLD